MILIIFISLVEKIGVSVSSRYPSDITNRLISNKNVSWNFLAPYDFTVSILARSARLRSERGTKIPAKFSLNPIQYSLIENARTVFESKN